MGDYVPVPSWDTGSPEPKPNEFSDVARDVLVTPSTAESQELDCVEEVVKTAKAVTPNVSLPPFPGGSTEVEKGSQDEKTAINQRELGIFDHLLRWWAYRSFRRGRHLRAIADRGLRYYALLQYSVACFLYALGWLLPVDEWIRRKATEYTFLGNVIATKPFARTLPAPPVLLSFAFLLLSSFILTLHVRTSYSFLSISLFVSKIGCWSAPIIFLVEVLLIYPFCWLPYFGQAKIKNFCRNEHEYLWEYPALALVYIHFLITVFYASKRFLEKHAAVLFFRGAPLFCVVGPICQVHHVGQITSIKDLQKTLKFLKENGGSNATLPDKRILRSMCITLLQYQEDDFSIGDLDKGVLQSIAHCRRGKPAVYGFAAFRIKSILALLKELLKLSSCSKDAVPRSFDAFYLGELHPLSGKPEGFGMWADLRRNGEKLVGFWKNGLPRCPFETFCPMTGDTFAGARIIVAHPLKGHDTASDSLGYGVAEVEACISGTPLSDYPCLLNIERCPSPAGRRFSVDIEMALLDKVKSPFNIGEGSPIRTRSPNRLNSPTNSDLEDRPRDGSSNMDYAPRPMKTVTQKITSLLQWERDNSLYNNDKSVVKEENGYLTSLSLRADNSAMWACYDSLKSQKNDVITVETLRLQQISRSKFVKQEEFSDKIPVRLYNKPRLVVLITPEEWAFEEAAKHGGSIASLIGFIENLYIVVASPRRPIEYGKQLARRVFCPCFKAELGQKADTDFLMSLFEEVFRHSDRDDDVEVHVVSIGTGVNRLLDAADRLATLSSSRTNSDGAAAKLFASAAFLVPTARSRSQFKEGLSKCRALVESAITIYAVTSSATRNIATEREGAYLLSCSPYWHATSEAVQETEREENALTQQRGVVEPDLLADALREFNRQGAQATAATLRKPEIDLFTDLQTGSSGLDIIDASGQLNSVGEGSAKHEAAGLGTVPAFIASRIRNILDFVAPHMVPAERIASQNATIVEDLRHTIISNSRASERHPALRQISDGIWTFQKSIAFATA